MNMWSKRKEAYIYIQMHSQTEPICHRQTEKTYVGCGGESHLVENSDIYGIAEDSKDADGYTDAGDIQVNHEGLINRCKPRYDGSPIDIG